MELVAPPRLVRSSLDICTAERSRSIPTVKSASRQRRLALMAQASLSAACCGAGRRKVTCEQTQLDGEDQVCDLQLTAQVDFVGRPGVVVSLRKDAPIVPPNFKMRRI